jgi:hypothetical protein
MHFVIARGGRPPSNGGRIERFSQGPVEVDHCQIMLEITRQKKPVRPECSSQPGFEFLLSHSA